MHTLLLSLVLSPAHAAEVTDMPPGLRGDIEVDYSGSFETGKLEEGGDDYGKRRFQRHDVTFGVEFAPVDGVAINVGIPTTPFMRVWYPDAYSMGYDPVSETGTYTFGDPLSEERGFSGGGLNGVWIGAALAPFAERYKLKQQVTWRIDLAYRTGSQNTFWSAADGGRGSAPGGQAFKIAAAFSTDKRLTNPYLKAEFINEGKTRVDVIDDDGTTWVSDLEVRPPSTVDVLGGVEIVSFYDNNDQSRVAVDLFMGFGYVTWGDVPSGLYLPDVLNASRTIAVTVGDHLRARTGFAVDGHITEYVGVRGGVHLGYASPYRLEHVYPVRTSLDTFSVGWNFRLEGRIR